ncbi:hypothetical protein [Vibrio harveyi]|uniref:hypothetical protein n=1 Tax=Vibrio harveyi TaxID=669 RepID=UPI003CF8738C
MEVGKHDVRFIFADGNTVDVWKSNRWYSYANLYKINGESIDEKNRPSLETMWRFYELTEVNQRIADEKRKAKQVALMKKFIK